MGERTLTIDAKKLLADSKKDLDKVREKLELLESLSDNKKKVKKLKKCKGIIDAAQVIIKSIEEELN